MYELLFLTDGCEGDYTYHQAVQSESLAINELFTSGLRHSPAADAGALSRLAIGGVLSIRRRSSV